jgi:hypothetical protein
MRKKLLISLGVLVGLVALLLLAVGFLAGHFARQGIERGATYALGVPTTVDSASISPIGGRLELAGVTVKNPPGYTTPHALTLGGGFATVTLSSLLKDTVQVPKFHLLGVDINLERHAGKANYQVIMDNLEKVIGPAPAQPPPDQKKFIIDELVIADISVHVQVLPDAASAVAGTLGAPTKIDVIVPNILLSGVGRTGAGLGGTGVTSSQLAAIVYEAVMAAVAEDPGAQGIPPEILGDLRGGLKDLKGLASVGMQIGGQAVDPAREFGDQLRKSGEDIKKQAEAEAEKARKELKGIGDEIGNVIGGKKKGGG